MKEQNGLTPRIAWSSLKKNSDGMVPVVVQDDTDNTVLMVAYMNEEAYNTTMRTGLMTYWSRSRNCLWTKGLTSGHIQRVKSLTADCDADTLLARVDQTGAACHTGRRSCFFQPVFTNEDVRKAEFSPLSPAGDAATEQPDTAEKDS